MTAVRWWTLDELEAAETLFAPRRLPALVRSLLEDGPPRSRSTSASRSAALSQKQPST